MNIKVIYKDGSVVVIDKPAGIVVFPEGERHGERSRTIIDLLLEKYPKLMDVGRLPRYGVVHRLDKDTSGILLVAKTQKALIFFQKQFKTREVAKKYTVLVTGTLQEENGTIHTLIGRSPADPRKQKVYPLETTGISDAREAISEYKVLQRFKEYTLLEVQIKTGRKHQIRAHMAYIHHPIAGDELYEFKDSHKPQGLARQFLHASYLAINLPNGEMKEFRSELPKDLQVIIQSLNLKSQS